MSDLICVKCGEPWNAYGVNHGDMKAWETDLFKKGAGCPCCKGNASIQLDKIDIDSVLTEEGNLIVPSEIKWEKPNLKILFKKCNFDKCIYH